MSDRLYFPVVTVTGDPAFLAARYAAPPKGHRHKPLHERQQRVARWLAWKRSEGDPGEDAWLGGYVELYPDEACVDGWYTAAQLRRIADAQEHYAAIMGTWRCE